MARLVAPAACSLFSLNWFISWSISNISSILIQNKWQKAWKPVPRNFQIQRCTQENEVGVNNHFKLRVLRTRRSVRDPASSTAPATPIALLLPNHYRITREQNSSCWRQIQILATSEILWWTRLLEPANLLWQWRWLRNYLGFAYAIQESLRCWFSKQNILSYWDLSHLELQERIQNTILSALYKSKLLWKVPQLKWQQARHDFKRLRQRCAAFWSQIVGAANQQQGMEDRKNGICD